MPNPYAPKRIYSTTEQAKDKHEATEVPDGTAKEIIEWVDGDPERALQALVAEESSDKPRSTLIAKLQEIIDA